jgi:hypothetical protein
MKGVRLFLTISIVLASASQFIAYGLAGVWVASAIFILVCGVWLLGIRRDIEGLSTVLFSVFLLTSVFGCLIQLSLPLLIFSMVAALTAWDLDYFNRQLRQVSDGKIAVQMEKLHLRRVLILTGLGLVLTEPAAFIKTGFGFWTVIFLVIMIILTAGLVIGYLRRSAT